MPFFSFCPDGSQMGSDSRSVTFVKPVESRPSPTHAVLEMRASMTGDAVHGVRDGG